MVFLEVESWNLGGRRLQITYRSRSKSSYYPVFLYILQIDYMIQSVGVKNTLILLINYPSESVMISSFQWDLLFVFLKYFCYCLYYIIYIFISEPSRKWQRDCSL